MPQADSTHGEYRKCAGKLAMLYAFTHHGLQALVKKRICMSDPKELSGQQFSVAIFPRGRSQRYAWPTKLLR